MAQQENLSSSEAPTFADNKPSALPAASSSKNPIESFYANMAEATYFKSPYVSDSYRPPYPIDDLWKKTGDYSIYEKMVQDDQINVCLQLKKDLVLGAGGSFEPTDEGQDEIIEELNEIFFNDYEGNFIEDLEEILTAYDFGFSLTEKVFKLREGSSLGLKCLRTRHPNSWRLHQDVKGAITAYEQITSDGPITMNPKSLIHYQNKKRFQNPYGVSDLRAAYNAWFTKTQVIRYMGIFLEKAASPIPVAKYNKNAPKDLPGKLLDILKKFQTKTALTIPEDVQVDFLEAKNNGDVYVKAINLFNMFIGRSLFTPDLTGFVGGETGGGSLALGDKQMNLFFLHIYRRRAILEAIVNNEIVSIIGDYNYGLGVKMPAFKLKPLDDDQAMNLAKVWISAVNGKAYQPSEEEVNHFRKLVKFPEGSVEFVQPPPPPQPFGQNQPPGLNQDKNQADNKGDGNEEDNGSDAGSAQDPKEQENESPTQKNFGKIYNLPPGNYYKKVNFKNIESKLNDYDNSVMAEAAPVVKRMISDLLDQIQNKKIIQNQNVTRIDSLSLKYKSQLKQILKDSFVSLYSDAQTQAAVEIDKRNFAKPVANDKFLQTIDQEAYQYIGDYEYLLTKTARTALIAAIKDGTSLSVVLDELKQNLGDLSDISIQRFARTKHTEVLNNARVDFFNDSGVVAGYQFSAILDDRTSDICAGLDGKIFASGDEPIPPMHFNCRSTLIPITKYEQFTPTKSIGGQSPQDFIDENKGKGFSTK